MKQTKRTKRKKVTKSKGKKIKHRKQRGAGSGDTFQRYLEATFKPIADAAVKIVKKLRQ